MSFTYPLTMPSQKPSSYKFVMKDIQSVVDNPFTGEQTFYEWPGRWMEFTLDFPPLTKAQSKEYNVFFMKLRGQIGSFYFTPPDYAREGSGGGTPLVASTGAEFDDELSLKGFPGSTLVLKAGDMLSTSNNELKIVMEDVTTDGSGNATVKIDPPLRQSVAVDSPIEIDEPKGIFRLKGKDIGYTANVATLYGISFIIRENI